MNKIAQAKLEMLNDALKRFDELGRKLSEDSVINQKEFIKEFYEANGGEYNDFVYDSLTQNKVSQIEELNENFSAENNLAWTAKGLDGEINNRLKALKESYSKLNIKFKERFGNETSLYGAYSKYKIIGDKEPVKGVLRIFLSIITFGVYPVVMAYREKKVNQYTREVDEKTRANSTGTANKSNEDKISIKSKEEDVQERAKKQNKGSQTFERQKGGDAKW